MRSLELLPEILFGKLDNFALLSIPMFIIMGSSIASTRAGADLYEALERWLTRVPGGLVISNLGACALFAAMSGSSPATCAAIGKMGIPEMRKRGYPDGVAAGSIAAGGTLGILIPPSVTMIVYGIATETSIGRLFLAGVIPGLLLVCLFMAWSLYSTWKSGDKELLASGSYTWRERFEILPRVLPFLVYHSGRALCDVRRHCDPVRNGSCGRPFVPDHRDGDLQAVEPERPVGRSARQHQRKRDDPVHHRCSGCVLLHAVQRCSSPSPSPNGSARLEVNRWVLMAASTSSC